MNNAFHEGTESGVNYMPDSFEETDVHSAIQLCLDEVTVSDSSGVANAIKWAHVVDVFDCDNCSIFSAISFEDIYMRDNTALCVAAAYVADLRTQYLRKALDRDPEDYVAHYFYLRNKQWNIKLRERVHLRYIVEDYRDELPQ